MHVKDPETMSEVGGSRNTKITQNAQLTHPKKKEEWNAWICSGPENKKR